MSDNVLGSNFARKNLAQLCERRPDWSHFGRIVTSNGGKNSIKMMFEDKRYRYLYMYMCVYVYLYIHIYIYTYIHVYIIYIYIDAKIYYWVMLHGIALLFTSQIACLDPAASLCSTGGETKDSVAQRTRMEAVKAVHGEIFLQGMRHESQPKESECVVSNFSIFSRIKSSDQRSELAELQQCCHTLPYARSYAIPCHMLPFPAIGHVLCL